MRLDHSFTVPVPVDDAWQVLLDLPRIAPCMPGATLTGVDGDSFTGTVKVKLGPVTLTYQGRGRFLECDADAHRAVIEASGRDTRAAGTAAATVTTQLSADGDRTHVDVQTDLTVTGRPAQFGRGMIGDVAGKLIGQFAECLAGTLSEQDGDAEPAPGGDAGGAAAVHDTAQPAGEPAPASAGEPATEPAQRVAEPVPPDLSPAAPSGPAPVAGPRPTPRPVPESVAQGPARPPAEAEPIDLLRLTGSTETAHRLARYALLAAVVAVVVWLLGRRRR